MKAGGYEGLWHQRCPQTPTMGGLAFGSGMIPRQGAVLTGTLLSHATALIQVSATMQV